MTSHDVTGHCSASVDNSHLDCWPATLFAYLIQTPHSSPKKNQRGKKGTLVNKLPIFFKCFMYLHVILITSEITPISKIIMQFWNKFQILSTWKAIHNLTRCTTLIKCYIAMAKHYAKKHVLKSSKCEHLETLY